MARSTRTKATRKSTKKFVTRSQGPRAYIEFDKPTWGEIREVVDEIRGKTKKYIQSVRAGVMQGETASQVEGTLSDALWEIAIEKFHDWNWVDDEGEDLAPLPELDMEDLYGDEIQEIFECVQALYMMSEQKEDAEGK
jgi:hypothetical protein